MPRESRHYDHLIRVGTLFAGGFLVFAIVRHVLVPPDFGVYGFYRAGALDDARDRPVVYAGRETCVVCHSEAVESQKGGRHADVGCESCHGPLAKHAAGEFDPKPKILNPRTLCLTCHVKMEGKYAAFPQVDPVEHAGDAACTACHKPHRPKIQ
jgi:hypothetical protein